MLMPRACGLLHEYPLVHTRGSLTQYIAMTCVVCFCILSLIQAHAISSS